MKPKSVSDLDMVFGGKVNELMPKYAEIPDEFKNGSTIWNRLFCQLFYSGGSLEHLKEKEGINRKEAIRHIRSIMGSWEPKHEHKEASVAYLFSQWFEPITEVQPTKQPA